MTETECVERALSEYQSGLVRFAYSILRDFQRAQDAVQKAYFEMVKRECCCSLDSPKAWLYRVCRHAAYGELRKGGRFVSEEEPERFEDGRAEEESGRVIMESEERNARLRELIEYLPEGQRQVLHLHYFDGFKLGDIAEILGKKANNIYQLHHAGLAEMRKRLAGGIEVNPGERAT